MYFDICGKDSRYAYCIKSKPFVVFFYTAIKYSKLKIELIFFVKPSLTKANDVTTALKGHSFPNTSR